MVAPNVMFGTKFLCGCVGGSIFLVHTSTIHIGISSVNVHVQSTESEVTIIKYQLI